MFKSRDQRHRYMQCLGTFYAGLGGTFGTYRDAQPAFQDAKTHRLYVRVGITDDDFCQFEAGFLQHQEFRAAMQLDKARAQKEMSDILTEVDLLGMEDKVFQDKDMSEFLARQAGR